MKRFITKPNSKIDKLLILISIMLSVPVWVPLITSITSIVWLSVVLTIVISIVTNLIPYCLYYYRYSPSFVEMRLKEKVADFLCVPGLGCYDIPKACKLIDEICNATIVQIEERKFLYDQMCTIWTRYGGGSIYKVYSVPGFITEKWKRAVVEYRKYEIEND